MFGQYIIHLQQDCSFQSNYNILMHTCIGLAMYANHVMFFVVLVHFFLLVFFPFFVIGVGIPDAVRCKATIRSRFSTLQYNNVVSKFNEIQRGYIISNGFPFLLNIPEHLMVPMPLTQWIIDHISYGCDGIFRHKSKSFRFYKDMVNAIFGFDYGSRPFEFGSSDPDVVAEVELLEARYTVNGKIPVTKVVTEMLADNTEAGFMRGFIMFFVTTILCPRTQNFVNPKLLFSLRKVSHIRKLDYGSYCYDHLFTELDKFKDKVFLPVRSTDYNRILWVGGCLPVLTVSNTVSPFLFLFLFCSPFYCTCFLLSLQTGS